MLLNFEQAMAVFVSWLTSAAGIVLLIAGYKENVYDPTDVVLGATILAFLPAIVVTILLCIFVVLEEEIEVEDG